MRKRPPLRPLPFEASKALVLRELRQWLLFDTKEWFSSYRRPSSGTAAVDDWLCRIQDLPPRWTVTVRLLPAQQVEKLTPAVFVDLVIGDVKLHR